MKLLYWFLIVLTSVVLHEGVHLFQIFSIDNMTYEGWGVGIRPFFYWIVEMPQSTIMYEVQAYGIQALFLIGAVLNKRININWRQKCVSYSPS